jgi:chorismate mutase
MPDALPSEEYMRGMRAARSIAWQAVLTAGAKRDTAWTKIDDRIKRVEERSKTVADISRPKSEEGKLLRSMAREKQQIDMIAQVMSDGEYDVAHQWCNDLSLRFANYAHRAKELDR